MAVIEIKSLGNPSQRLLMQMALARNQRGALAALGKRAEAVLRDHFRMLDKRPNKKGWPRTHFWNREVAQKTAYIGIEGSAAVVRIGSPAFAQKLFGGRIRARSAKALAIPIAAEAYGKRPRERDDRDQLVVIPRKGKPPLLVKKQSGELRPQYVLKKSVEQKAQPDALPKSQTFWGALNDTLTQILNRQ